MSIARVIVRRRRQWFAEWTGIRAEGCSSQVGQAILGAIAKLFRQRKMKKMLCII